MELVSVSLEERCHIDRRVDDVWADLREFGSGVGLRADGSCSVTLLVRISESACMPTGLLCYAPSAPQSSLDCSPSQQ